MTELYTVCKLGNGHLSVMPKPDSEQMETDIEYYRTQGVTQVISLLLPEEIQKLEMAREPALCEALGIEFIHFAIKDMSVPEPARLKAFNADLQRLLEDGHHLAIHCHGGRGRAGIVAITLMIEHDIEAELAIQMASQARGDRMPVNDLQTDFVKQYQPLNRA